MRWRRFGRRLKKYLGERVTLTLVPHARGNLRGIHLPRIILIAVFLMLFGYIFSVTYLYQNYQDRFVDAQATIVALQNVKTENVTLKAGLTQVVKETEKMREIITELEKKGQYIESMLSNSSSSKSTLKEENKDLIFFNYKLLDGQGIPVGGGSDEYLTTDGFELLSQIREELIMLRAEVPIHVDVLEELESNVEEHNALKRATPTGWPLNDNGAGYVSSEFGWRKDPITGQQTFHDGIDIGVWYGTPVISTADGKVIFSGWKNGYGRIVVVDHGYGYQTWYGHNSKLAVQKGDKVKRGTVIAYSGNSGKSTGPHLHYEIRVNGIPKNPRSFNFRR